MLPVFATVTDQIGHQHKVHKACVDDAEKELRQITAQEKKS
jgi:hypothetical protein